MFEVNKEKSGLSDAYQKIKQDFYSWVDSTKIKKSNCPADLKTILFNFHEILEGQGDEWAKQLADESEKEVASWSKEKLEYEMERGLSAINENLETIEQENELLEGKNWNQITLKNKFNGNAERGKEIFFQIVSSNGQQEERQQEKKPQQTSVEADKKPTNYLAFWIIGGLALAGVLIGIIWLTHKNNKKRKISKQT